MNPPLSDEERELHIQALGRLMQKAYREGDTTGAHQWLGLQREAILSRSAEQVAKLERERGLDEGCYFCAMGDKARQAAVARGAS